MMRCPSTLRSPNSRMPHDSSVDGLMNSAFSRSARGTSHACARGRAPPARSDCSRSPSDTRDPHPNTSRSRRDRPVPTRACGISSRGSRRGCTLAGPVQERDAADLSRAGRRPSRDRPRDDRGHPSTRSRKARCDRETQCRNGAGRHLLRRRGEQVWRA